MNNLQHDMKYAVPNLRFRWKEQLQNYSDEVVARCYHDFSLSEDFGNNDEKFPEWFDLLETYQGSQSP